MRIAGRGLAALLCLAPTASLLGADTLAPAARNRGALWSAQSLEASQAPAGLQRLATSIVLENLPQHYVDTRDWGGTRERFDGLDIRRDGLEIRTKRKRKTVNHGTWKRYEITQIDPERNLKVRISQARTMPDGRAAFEVELVSKINGVARLSRWNRGVRLFSITLDADAEVRLVLDCRLDVELDLSRLPPDVVLRPEVVQAEVQLAEFRVNRISHLDGPVARELGNGLKQVLRKQMDHYEPKMVAKMNRQIERHQDDLRLSLHEAWQKRWQEFQGKPAQAESTEQADAGPAANLTR